MPNTDGGPPLARTMLGDYRHAFVCSRTQIGVTRSRRLARTALPMRALCGCSRSVSQNHWRGGLHAVASGRASPRSEPGDSASA